MQLKNRTILITGGATGIGYGLAQHLHAQGNLVIITGRRVDKLRDAQKALHGLLYFPCDVSDPDSIDWLFKTLKEMGILLDVVFNNAGVLEIWDVLTQHLPSKDIFTKINTNLTGAIAITQYFIRQANPASDNYIVNISTEAAIMPIPVMPLYSASKAGLNAFTRALRVQLKVAAGFHVIEIVPPATESKMTTEDMKNTTKLANPKVFALQVIKQIEAGKTYYAPSANAKLLTFIRRVFPSAGLNIIDKLSRKQLLG